MWESWTYLDREDLADERLSLCAAEALEVGDVAARRVLELDERVCELWHQEVRAVAVVPAGASEEGEESGPRRWRTKRAG